MTGFGRSTAMPATPPIGDGQLNSRLARPVVRPLTEKRSVALLIREAIGEFAVESAVSDASG